MKSEQFTPIVIILRPESYFYLNEKEILVNLESSLDHLPLGSTDGFLKFLPAKNATIKQAMTK